MNNFELTYIVEDDPIAATITKILLEKSLPGGRVQTYTNGQQALDHLTTALREGTGAVPDLILLDLNMPLLDGWEFLDVLNGLLLPRPVCILVLTSSINAEDQAKAASYPNVAGYFAKPLDVHGVVQMLRLRRKASGPVPPPPEPAQDSLHHLVYQSIITASMDEPALVGLLTQSRAFNAAHGLTGVLLYNEREFLQLLEGPRGHVHAVFDRIARDPRHHKVVKLADGPVAHRQFAQWSMGFRAVHPVNFAHFAGYAASGLGQSAGCAAALPDATLHTLLATFEAGQARPFES